MKKKGFTIVELLVVMAIIIAVTATSVVSYTRITSNMKEKEYNRIISQFEAAAEVYVASSPELRERIYMGEGYATVTLRVLAQQSLIDLQKNTDPITGKPFDERNYITIGLDENKNFYAKYMSTLDYSFTNTRSKQSILAGSKYGRSEILEYVNGYVRGEYDESTATYTTRGIDYRQVVIKITDITDPENPVEITNELIPTTGEYVNHKFKIEYTFHFPDGDRKSEREVNVYNIAPTLKSISLTPDLTTSNQTASEVTITALAESIHNTLYYHFIVEGVDVVRTVNSYTLLENATVQVYVEDEFGSKSDTLTKTITYIQK